MEMNQLYVAGVGLVSAIGDSAEMNWCSFNAGVNRYTLSDYRSSEFSPVKMALIPEGFFGDLPESVDLGVQTSMRHTRILLAAQSAIHEALSGFEDLNIANVPLVQACPNLLPADSSFNKTFRENLFALNRAGTSGEPTHHYYRIGTGRSAVVEGIEHAFKLFEAGDIQFALVGGSDSFDDPDAIKELDAMKRLNCENGGDGFSPGDGAAYILLTSVKEHALRSDGKCIAVSRPAVGFEEGHLYSKAPYLGDGLAACFKEALESHKEEDPIKTIYSSMNGENIWAKEYGVALLRNNQYFSEDPDLKHPADCYGDLGTACGGALVILAALDLLHRKKDDNCLVYTSSDHGYRAATIIGLEPVAN